MLLPQGEALGGQLMVAAGWRCQLRAPIQCTRSIRCTPNSNGAGSVLANILDGQDMVTIHGAASYINFSRQIHDHDWKRWVPVESRRGWGLFWGLVSGNRHHLDWSASLPHWSIDLWYVLEWHQESIYLQSNVTFGSITTFQRKFQVKFFPILAWYTTSVAQQP